MLAGGSGITPMLQVIRTVFNNPEDKTQISLIYGNATEKDILFRDELDEIQRKHPNQFKVTYVVEKVTLMVLILN